MQLLLLLVACLNTSKVYAFQWTLAMDSFKNCPDKKNLPVYFHDAVIFTKNGFGFAVNYNITIRSLVKGPLESQFVIEKCSSREALDSCSQFYSFRNGDYCQFMSAKDELWSSFVDCVTPKYACPFKKGNYYAKNCTLDFEKFRMFPLQPAYWKCRIIVTDKTRKKNVKSCAAVGGVVRIKY